MAPGTDPAPLDRLDHFSGPGGNPVSLPEALFEIFK
jgi:hypothetical protein